MNNPNLSGWKAMIVDDAHDNAIIAEKVFRHWGADVVVCDSGEEALSILDEAQPTFILLDLDMPDLTGWEVCNIIRENNSYDDIPIFAFTAHAMPSEKYKIIEEGGFDGCITKPFSIQELVTDIQSYLAHH